MRMHHKAMLAIACTAALSACDSEKAANSIAKRAPLPLPDAGLYEASLLSRDNDKASFKMIKGLEGMALIYPKADREQRWGVWVDKDAGKVATNSQWSGKAAQKENKDGIYPVLLERTSERGNKVDSQSNDHNLITFRDQSVIDVNGKEVKRWTFDFTRTGPGSGSRIRARPSTHPGAATSPSASWPPGRSAATAGQLQTMRASPTPWWARSRAPTTAAP